MKYVTIVDGKIAITDTYSPQNKYAILFKYNDKEDVHLFSDAPVVVSGDNVIIGTKTVPLKDLHVVPIDEHFEEILSIIQSHGSNDISTRSISDRLPDPRATKMHTFTSVVCFAILANGRTIPLAKKDRVRKANLIRNVKKQIEKDSEISIALGFELLELFGINPEEIFNVNYIVK
jgi:hypothetical protein